MSPASAGHRIGLSCDVNVYLDVAAACGIPKPEDTMETYINRALSLSGDMSKYPHPCRLHDMRHIDTLRAIALASDIGNPANTAWQVANAMKVFRISTCEWTLESVVLQLQIAPAFQWSQYHAEKFTDLVVMGVVRRTGGVVTSTNTPIFKPPLDRDDGLVLAGAKLAGSSVLLSTDGDFNLDPSLAASGFLFLYPDEFIERVQTMRQRMGPGVIQAQLHMWRHDNTPVTATTRRKPVR